MKKRKKKDSNIIKITKKNGGVEILRKDGTVEFKEKLELSK